MNEEQPHSSDGPSKKSLLSRLTQMFHIEPKDRQQLVEFIRESEENHLIDHDTRDMLEGVIEIADLRVRDIMIPRSQMVILEKHLTLDQLLAILNATSHSRYPVINEDKDHIEGILLAKDLLRYLVSDSEAFDIEKIIRPAVVIPESKRVDRLLKNFRQERYHMAMVADEFGGISGLVTIEDILEEIVGNIEDEYDDDDLQTIRKMSKRTFMVKALTPITDFNEVFSSEFSADEVDTIGGMVMTWVGHMPKRGESINIDGFIFKVAAADNRRILQLHVTIPETASYQPQD